MSKGLENLIAAQRSIAAQRLDLLKHGACAEAASIVPTTPTLLTTTIMLTTTGPARAGKAMAGG